MNFRLLCTVLLAALIAGSAFADDVEGTKPKREKKNRDKSKTTQLVKRLGDINLTEEQVAKINELEKAVEGKSKAIRDESGITDELIKKRKAAQKSLRKSGKKGKELMAAVNEEVGLTEEQVKALTEIAGLQTKLQQETVALLTDEQMENLPAKMKKELNRAKGKKKGKKADGKKKKKKKKKDEA